MARLQENVSLQPFNTFGLDLNARWFFKVKSPEAALEFLMDNQEAGRPVLILGGGSNVLFRSDFPGLVLYNQIKGYTVVKEDGDHVWLKVGAGENWHQLVLYTLSRNWGGLENLSLIPGSVGAAPIQNIGAYGVEQKEVFWELNAIHLTTGSFCRFTKEECQFGYRDSIFKRQAKGSYLIYSVTFRLNKKPVLNTSYGAIERELKDLGLEPTIHSVSQAVINIRSRKLPNPAQIGNSGSFFKNPVISPPQFKVLAESYPDAPHYPQADGSVKVPAGWLIEKSGWKGYRSGNYGVHQHQALVLVNHGGATGEEIFQLSEKIMQDVQTRFNIVLEREVNVIG